MKNEAGSAVRPEARDRDKKREQKRDVTMEDEDKGEVRPGLSEEASKVILEDVMIKEGCLEAVRDGSKIERAVGLKQVREEKDENESGRENDRCLQDLAARDQQDTGGTVVGTAGRPMNQFKSYVKSAGLAGRDGTICTGTSGNQVNHVVCWTQEGEDLLCYLRRRIHGPEFTVGVPERREEGDQESCREEVAELLAVEGDRGHARASYRQGGGLEIKEWNVDVQDVRFDHSGGRKDFDPGIVERLIVEKCLERSGVRRMQGARVCRCHIETHGVESSRSIDPGGTATWECSRSPERNTWESPRAKRDTCNGNQKIGDRQSMLKGQEVKRVSQTTPSLTITIAMFNLGQLHGEARAYVERRKLEAEENAYEEARQEKTLDKVIGLMKGDAANACVPPDRSRRGSLKPLHGCRCEVPKYGHAIAFPSKLDLYKVKPGVAGMRGGNVAGMGAGYFVECGIRTEKEASVGRKVIRKARENEEARKRAREEAKARDHATKAYLESKEGLQKKEEVLVRVKAELWAMGVNVGSKDDNNNDE